MVDTAMSYSYGRKWRVRAREAERIIGPIQTQLDNMQKRIAVELPLAYKAMNETTAKVTEGLVRALRDIAAKPRGGKKRALEALRAHGFGGAE